MVVCGVLNVFVCVCDLLRGGVRCGCLGVRCVFACDVNTMCLCVLLVMYTVMLYGLSLCVACVVACVFVLGLMCGCVFYL